MWLLLVDGDVQLMLLVLIDAATLDECKIA